MWCHTTNHYNGNIDNSSQDEPQCFVKPSPGAFSKPRFVLQLRLGLRHRFWNSLLFARVFFFSTSKGARSRRRSPEPGFGKSPWTQYSVAMPFNRVVHYIVHANVIRQRSSYWVNWSRYQQVLGSHLSILWHISVPSESRLDIRVSKLLLVIVKVQYPSLVSQ